MTLNQQRDREEHAAAVARFGRMPRGKPKEQQSPIQRARFKGQNVKQKQRAFWEWEK